jgi:hypothetical protein
MPRLTQIDAVALEGGREVRVEAGIMPAKISCSQWRFTAFSWLAVRTHRLITVGIRRSSWATLKGYYLDSDHLS